MQICQRARGRTSVYLRNLPAWKGASLYEKPEGFSPGFSTRHLSYTGMHRQVAINITLMHSMWRVFAWKTSVKICMENIVSPLNKITNTLLLLKRTFYKCLWTFVSGTIIWVFCPWIKSNCAVQLDKFHYVFWYTSSVENGKPFFFSPTWTVWW